MNVPELIEGWRLAVDLDRGAVGHDGAAIPPHDVAAAGGQLLAPVRNVLDELDSVPAMRRSD
jgi:hypothetical protein